MLYILAVVAIIGLALISSCREPGQRKQETKPHADVQASPHAKEDTHGKSYKPVSEREPEGFREARKNAEMLNSRFEIEEPPYRYYACGYVVLMFPADPETIERNREQYIELMWSEEEFKSQLQNSKTLWSRLIELEGVSTPDELMDLLFEWVQKRTPLDNEVLWKSRFREAFQKFSDGEFTGR
jgi:hypothetical protein